MRDDNVLALAKYRLDQANECLRSAEMVFTAGSFRFAVNRSYYCIFHAMRAVLALDMFETKKHSGIISAFRQKYIKTDIFPEKFSVIIRNAFNTRNAGDYQDFFIVSKEEAAHIENASIFLQAVEHYLENIE